MTDPELVRVAPVRISGYELEHDVDPLDVADAYDMLGPARGALPAPASAEHAPYDPPGDPLGARDAARRRRLGR